jgi:D-beta-D-heptose 7-phosphate kinase/D-beta-D-heptose 1-phosphate adenosyltransferase
MDLTLLNALLARIPGRRVVCVGDLMVDRFIYGEVTRVSPEAPIPVLSQSREMQMLGAAGNVARNVAALGGAAEIVSVVGEDREGEEAQALLDGEAGVRGRLTVDPGRPTTLKTRFVSAGQQLLRMDREVARPIGGAAEERLIASIAAAAAGCDAILLSDYGKGVVTEAVIAACRAAAEANGARLVVDSKARSFGRYGAVDLIKPNAAELGAATDLPTQTDEEVEAALTKALALWDAKAVLVTRAAQGMSLGVRGEKVVHVPTLPVAVFDVSGAGDTTLAALGLALAADAPMPEAVAFAQLAARIAVGKVGTATVEPRDLIEAVLSARIAPAEAKLATLQRMVEEVARWRAQGLRIGFTNGCFDILHKGHVAYLHEARSWCDRLIVGLNSDASVRALKGEGRPVNDLESRALVLAGLGCVDLVAPFEEATPLRLIEAARPDVLVKGSDYTEAEVVGAREVRSWGGEVKLARIVDGYSTTSAIARMKQDG